MEASRRIRIEGHVSPAFDSVRDAFAENFSRRHELGGACCVYHRGEKVVDLWGGVRNKSTGEPWQEDTMVLIWSATKGLAAMTLAVAHSRGWLDYEERVCTYWPEFAQHGKETITVRQLLAHQAGLFAFDEPVDKSVVADLDRLAVVLARQKPAWEPGTRRPITRSLSASTKASCCAESMRSTAASGSSFRTKSLHHSDWISTSVCPTRSRTPGWRRLRAQAWSQGCLGFPSD
jgi:Beta-lactamase